MTLRLYNTLTRREQVFIPINKKEVGMYTCGPTVYWYQHIGNLRSYVFSDILKRVLIFNGYNVKHVINITDVGHLTSDADEGEDKIEKAALREHKTAKEITNYYFEIFEKDLKKLNILEPNIWCKATEHIKEQIELIKKLEEKGYTYETSDGIYFDTSKLKDYGKLALLNIENLQAGKRIEIGDKKNKTDFALWKFSEMPGKRQQEWKSPWGIGFPGWHIECSAMSMKYLGETFDIHTGGEDHIPVHHTNEIAQSEAATGKKFVNYWVHGAFLNFNNEKMSKSTGGILTLSELNNKGYSPMIYRYFLLTAKYRSQLNFTFENLDNAKNTYERLKRTISSLLENNEKSKNADDKRINEIYLKKFEEAINDDLDMPKALQVLWELIKNEHANGKIGTIAKMDEVFGLDLLKQEKVSAIPSEIMELVNQREEARKNKHFQRADTLRAKIKLLGYKIDDTNEGVRVSKI
ncbi:MAG: cysteine--tRNA ligase [Nanoarchaeota archaeon]